MSLVEIDGARGEGGGQIVRTAAAMSACTGRGVRVRNARANRDTAGLRPQHVAALEAVAEACGGELEGVEVGAESFALRPGEVRGGRVRVDTGTAANTILIAQTLVPLTDRLDEPLTVLAKGGTDVRFAPTLTYFRRVFVPWARRLGVPIEVGQAREGFYPVGGGRLSVTIGPREPPELDEPLLERGELSSLDVQVRIADLPEHIAERITATAVEELAGPDHEVATETRRVDADCPGVVVDALASFDDTVLGANALGEQGVPSETVARNCAGDLLAERAGPGTVDVHLADQLVPLLPDAPGAGYRVREASSHLETNVAVVEAFRGEAVELVDASRGWVVRSLR